MSDGCCYLMSGGRRLGEPCGLPAQFVVTSYFPNALFATIRTGERQYAACEEHVGWVVRRAMHCERVWDVKVHELRGD